jgi:hypothetical protein
MTSILLILFYLFVFIFSGAFVKNANAYLDPGTGSYIFQIFIAVVVGGIFLIKLYLNRIISFFKNSFLKKGKNGNT